MIFWVVDLAFHPTAADMLSWYACSAPSTASPLLQIMNTSASYDAPGALICILCMIRNWLDDMQAQMGQQVLQLSQALLTCAATSEPQGAMLATLLGLGRWYTLASLKASAFILIQV
jgi:hypothetical protein